MKKTSSSLAYGGPMALAMNGGGVNHLW